MWRRFRRMSLAPRRPVLFQEQYAVALVTVVVIGASIALVVYALR